MFNTLSIFNTIYNDAPQPWQIGFQDSAAPGFTGIVELHNTIFFYLIVICVGVFWVLGSSIYYFNIKNSPIIHKYLNHGRYVPIQKCSKFYNKNLINKVYVPLRTYTTLPENQLENDNINYIKVYKNIFEMRKDILNENKGKSGIYMLTNKITNDKYIGQSINISNRFKNYFNLSYIKSQDSLRISRALIKYGYFNFSLTILEYCEKSDLLIREKYYIEKLNPQYNIAGRSLNSKHIEETKEKFSKLLNGVYITEKSSLFGRHQAEEIKKLMSLSKIKETNKFIGKALNANSIQLMIKEALSRKHSEDIKLKMRAVSGNPVNIYEKFSSEGFNLIGSFVSARRAGKFLGISGSTVIKYMNSGEIYKDRYKFSSQKT